MSRLTKLNKHRSIACLFKITSIRREGKVPSIYCVPDLSADVFSILLIYAEFLLCLL